MSKSFKERPQDGIQTQTSESMAIEATRKFLSQIKPKFFRRNLDIHYDLPNPYLSSDNEKLEQLRQAILLPKLRVKRYYLRKLVDKHSFSSDAFCRQLPLQTIKYMTHIVIPIKTHKGIQKVLKSAKYLRNISSGDSGIYWTDTDVHDLCQLLNFASKYISTVSLGGCPQISQEGDKFKLYKTLSKFRQLKTFINNLIFLKEQRRAATGILDSFEMQQILMHRYLKNLPCLKDVELCQIIKSRALGEYLRKERSLKFPLVTTMNIATSQDMLPMNLDLTDISKHEPRPELGPLSLEEKRALPSEALKQYFTGLFELTKEDDDHAIQRKSKAQLLYEKNSEQQAGMRGKLIQKFDFEVFPNLKALNLFSNFYSLNTNPSFIAGGFVTLKNLEKLNARFYDRPSGTKFFFEEILNLPLLTHFSLRIPFIREEEWDLFAQFLQKQHNLNSLCLRVDEFDTSSKERYQNLCSSFGKAIAALRNTSKLEHLELQFEYCLFNKFAQECLSQGLEKALTTVKQLKSFSFKGSFLPIEDKIPSWSHLQGFFRFIQQQKQSLTSLTINLSVDDAGAAIEISNILPDLQELENLSFSAFNYYKDELRTLLKESILQVFGADAEKEITKRKDRTWDALANQIPKILPRLPKLEELGLEMMRTPFSIDEYQPSWDYEIFFPIIEILPKLKALKDLCIVIPPEILDKQKWKKEVKEIILGLKQVNTIILHTANDGRSDFAMDIEIENARKSVRCEYSKKLFESIVFEMLWR